MTATPGTATTGDAAAVATITRFPESCRTRNPEGKLDAVLGDPGDPEVEVQKILIREGIEEPHPAEAVAEAEAYGAEVDPAAFAGRVDLTGVPLPTIDPEDARDHDDAIWVTRSDDGSYKAWIAIADVSHYVRPGTALDESALGRGCSIYLPDRAIPMLPRALSSSNLCSLLPNVIRLCLAVEVDLDPTGTVLRSRLVEGFMRSAAKLTYGGVARALGFTPEPPRSEEAESMRDDLAVLADLARLLRARRMRKGALDFDLPEAKVTLDPETRAPLSVQKRTHDPGVARAYHLVEELMLLANEQVALFLVERDVPAIFRVHGAPDPDKISRFATMCSELGVKFHLEDAEDPKKLSVFLKKIQNHPQKQVLHMLLLRAMRQAQYDVANKGHFGLASSAYLHLHLADPSLSGSRRPPRPPPRPPRRADRPQPRGPRPDAQRRDRRQRDRAQIDGRRARGRRSPSRHAHARSRRRDPRGQGHRPRRERRLRHRSTTRSSTSSSRASRSAPTSTRSTTRTSGWSGSARGDRIGLGDSMMVEIDDDLDPAPHRLRPPPRRDPREAPEEG